MITAKDARELSKKAIYDHIKQGARDYDLHCSVNELTDELNKELIENGFSIEIETSRTGDKCGFIISWNIGNEPGKAMQEIIKRAEK